MPSSFIYLVRHGQSNGNVTEDYSTDLHDNLTDLGRQQAELLAERLSRHSFDHIFTSPLGRTKQTILPYVRAFRKKAEVWPELAECCWQEDRSAPPTKPDIPYDDFPLEEKERDFMAFRDGCRETSPAVVETFGDGLKRMEQSATRLMHLMQREQVSILVSAHGYVIGKLLHYLTGAVNLLDFPDIDNTSITKLIPGGNGGLLKIEYKNCTRHLSGSKRN